MEIEERAAFPARCMGTSNLRNSQDYAPVRRGRTSRGGRRPAVYPAGRRKRTLRVWGRSKKERGTFAADQDGDGSGADRHDDMAGRTDRG